MLARLDGAVFKDGTISITRRFGDTDRGWA